MRRLFLLFVVGAFLISAGGTSAAELGSSRAFFVNKDFDVSARTTLTATLRAQGTHAAFYVDDTYWSGLSQSAKSQYLSQLESLTERWDSALWPRATALWGEEERPGVDGDPHLVVLLERLRSGSGGYFETIHTYPVSSAPDSNAAEMVFISADSVSSGIAAAFLTHEFQHLQSFTTKEDAYNVEEDTWLNESRSEYGITGAGLSEPFSASALERRVASFQRTPSDSLVAWPNSSTDYAIASLFAHYLVDRYGTDILTRSLRSQSVGIPSLDEWLASGRWPERFADVFADWMAAVIVNDRSVDVRYGYALPALRSVRVSPSTGERVSVNDGAGFSLTAQEWQPVWTDIEINRSDVLPPYAVVEVAGGGSDVWSGSVVATYGSSPQVFALAASPGRSAAQIPTERNGQVLNHMILGLTQGSTDTLGARIPATRTATVLVTLGNNPVDLRMTAPRPGALRDGDLMRRPGQPEVYVVWGKFRRYLGPGVLELYGFQNRPVTEVDDSTFFSYDSSNYIRPSNDQPVYAVWPDGTKHWLHITPGQWDASGRDWGAIFIVNEREAAYYATGTPITR